LKSGGLTRLMVLAKHRISTSTCDYWNTILDETSKSDENHHQVVTSHPQVGQKLVSLVWVLDS
jgi:hypothetical protein